MSLVTALPYVVCLLPALLLSYYIFRRRDTRNLAPGPPSLPIVGSLLSFAMHKRRHRTAFRAVGAWQKKYGDIFRLRFGTQEAVVISGYELVMDALQTKKLAFDRRPALAFTENLTYGYGLAFSNGQMWRETHKFAAVALREMGVGKRSLEEHICEEASILIKTLETHKKPVFPRELLMRVTANVVLQICFSMRSDYEDAEFIKMLHFLDILLQHWGVQVLENFWPWIEYIPKIARMPMLRASDKVVFDYIMLRIHEHKATFDDAHIRGLMDLHIKQRQQWEDEKMKSDFHLCRTVLDLIRAGTETSATILNWLILHMVKYPEIQAKCQGEIDKVVGPGRGVLLKDKPELVYNVAVINEVQRHTSLAPLGAPRQAVEDVSIGGFLVPKDAIAIFNLNSVHHDKTCWGEDAEEFRPERWIDETGQLRTFEGFVPFGLGTRRCVGEPLANMQVFLIFTNMIQRLTFKLPAGSPTPSMEGDQQGIVKTPEEYFIISEPR